MSARGQEARYHDSARGGKEVPPERDAGFDAGLLRGCGRAAQQITTIGSKQGMGLAAFRTLNAQLLDRQTRCSRHELSLSEQGNAPGI